MALGVGTGQPCELRAVHPSLQGHSLKVRVLLELGDGAEGHRLLLQADDAGRIGGVGKHTPCGHRLSLAALNPGPWQRARSGPGPPPHPAPPRTIAVDRPQLLRHPEHGLHPELGPIVPVKGGRSPALETPRVRWQVRAARSLAVWPHCDLS